MPLGRARLAGLACPHETIFGERSPALPAVIAWSNMDVCGDPAFASRMLNGSYRARVARSDPVTLVSLPPGAMVLGGNSFLVLTGDTLVQEQINPLLPDAEALAQEMRGRDGSIIDVEPECVLVARYGEAVWGHWLAEILPRAVAAERAHPGRFRFVVPEHTTLPAAEGRSFARSVLESLAAYGIAPERLIRVSGRHTMRFRRLFMVDAVWSDAAPHPDVLELMRTGLRQPAVAGLGGRVAVLRRDTANRSLFNGEQVATALTAEGYTLTEMGRLSFLEQVAVYRDAEQVFGVLGSGMTGLIYAPDHVRVITATPANWFDFYFYVLIQLRRGLNAEIRGHPIWTGVGVQRDAPIVIDPRNLGAAIGRMRMTLDAIAPDGMMRAAGVSLPRWPGPCVLEIDFAEGGNASAHLGEGWAAQEALHIWSLGAQSGLVLPLLPVRDDYQLELHVAAFTVAPYLPVRRLVVHANGIMLTDVDVSGPATISCPLPRACLEGFERLALVLGTPVCAPASMLGAGPDTRPLGIALMSLRVRIQEATAPVA